jgi:hypothetical protein
MKENLENEILNSENLKNENTNLSNELKELDSKIKSLEFDKQTSNERYIYIKIE